MDRGRTSIQNLCLKKDEKKWIEVGPLYKISTYNLYTK